MSESLRDGLIRTLPYARRYARALTGSQPDGDLLVAEGLRNLSSQRSEDGFTPLQQLYKVISRLYVPTEGQTPSPVRDITTRQRQLLLLTSLEDVGLEMAGRIVGLSEKQAQAELTAAQELIRKGVQTSVLIIEDEPIIAMDIEQLVLQCGHSVAGVAHTQEDAIQMAVQTRPGLVLADINLGYGGDGMAAVAEIITSFHVPVIYVTAYPERLLTGQTLEPSYVITKPFDPMALAVATYQAVSSAGMAQV